MVVFVHAIATFEVKVGGDSDVDTGFGFGSFGVKLFFCISGYIIFTSIRPLAPSGAAMREFVRRRLIRIVPLYWAATLIYAAKLSAQGLAPSLQELACSLFFLPYANQYGVMRPILGTGWTLNCEMFFYLILAILVLASRAIRLPVALGILVALVAARASGLLAADATEPLHAIYLLSDIYLLFFCAGMLLAWAIPLLPAGPVDRLSWTARCSLLFIGLLLFVELTPHLHLPFSGEITAELLAGTWAVALCAKVDGQMQREPAGRFQRLVVMSGDGSYSTYLTHGFVMGPLARLVHSLHMPVTALEFAWAMVILCTAVGIVIFKYVEKPILSRLNVRSGSLAPVASTGA